MFQKTIHWTIFIYGALLISLGFLGYFRSGSLVSLISGAGSGLILVLCALGIQKKQKAGFYTATILSFFLTAMFAYRYTVTGKSLPGFLAIVSGGMALFLFIQFVKWRKKDS